MQSKDEENKGQGGEFDETESEMSKMHRSRTWRRVETLFLGVLFVGLTCLLYQVLTTDKIMVLAWFGIKVRNQPINAQHTYIPAERRQHRHDVVVKPIPVHRGNVSEGDGLFLDKTGVSNSVSELNDKKYVIAIGCAITSRGIQVNSPRDIPTAVTFLRTFFPSFCKTKPPDRHMYRIYLAYDQYDSFFMKLDTQKQFISSLRETQKILCPEKMNIEVVFHACSHNSHPAWAQNDAMYLAYLDGADYFYRINDDTLLTSSNWTEIMLNFLKSRRPPNVGVAGPAHKGGNGMILVHDFVHKTHIDIFGFYYPRTFPDWWADDWISGVYGSERTGKLDDVEAIHTGEKGTRYNHSWIPPATLSGRLTHDRATLNRYLKCRYPSPDSPPSDAIIPKGKAVISMSLYGNDPKYNFGAIRNAQLQPIIFPGWTMRFYIESPSSSGQTVFPKVPDRIVNKLKSLGAEIVHVNANLVHVPPMMWRFLVADDFSTDIFIVRDSDSRLIARDHEIVSEWLESDRPFHCVRDHPSHKSYPAFGGLVGGRTKELSAIVGERWQALMKSYKDDYGLDLEFLSNQIWPRVKYSSLCHDSVSCRDWPNAWPFPTPRKDYEHVGQVFDAFGQARSIDTDLLKLYREPWECTLRGGESRQSWLLKQQANGKPNGGLQEKHKVEQSDIRQYVEEIKRKEETNIPYLTGKAVIWTMDYGTKYVRDLKEMLSDRGVKFIDKSLAADCQAAGTCPHNLTVITPENGMTANKQLIQDFYERYKNDPEMAEVTHCLCVQPVAMCELCKPLKKSLIIVTSGRYEMGRIDPERWTELNAFLRETEEDQKNIVGANNHYDVEYMRYFTGFDPEYLPNLAMFSNITYKHSRSEFLITRLRDADFKSWFIEDVERALGKAKSEERMVYVDHLYPHGYNNTQLASHPGIILIPEKVSDIMYSELYRMNVPLFMPSLELLSRWQQKFGILRNRTNNAERLRRFGISLKISPIHPVAAGRFDPNDDVSGMSLRYWLRFADFLQYPHVLHYDSVDELVDLLTTTDLRATSVKMKAYNKKFKFEILSKWINLINRTLL